MVDKFPPKCYLLQPFFVRKSADECEICVEDGSCSSRSEVTTLVHQLEGAPASGKRDRKGVCLNVKIPFDLMMILAPIFVLL